MTIEFLSSDVSGHLAASPHMYNSQRKIGQNISWNTRFMKHSDSRYSLTRVLSISHSSKKSGPESLNRLARFAKWSLCTGRINAHFTQVQRL